MKCPKCGAEPPKNFCLTYYCPTPTCTFVYKFTLCTRSDTNGDEK